MERNTLSGVTRSGERRGIQIQEYVVREKKIEIAEIRRLRSDTVHYFHQNCKIQFLLFFNFFDYFFVSRFMANYELIS